MKYITYVSDVTHELDVVTPNFNNISDLFKHLMLPNYSTELIILSHHTIKQCSISIYDILSTIKSLCNQSTKPKIAIATDISISPTDLKELLESWYYLNTTNDVQRSIMNGQFNLILHGQAKVFIFNILISQNFQQNRKFYQEHNLY